MALLDLESHPPDSAIDRVTVVVDPTPVRVVQFSLLTRPLPSPEHLSTLAARLAALMGEGRCGSPELVDSWRPGACAMKPFAPRDSDALHFHKPRRHEGTEEKNGFLRDSVSPWPVDAKNATSSPVMALRRFRIPIPARVRADDGRPERVWIDRRGFGGGQVETAAGPWRTSGAWWEGERLSPKPSGEGGWDRDEWDVTLADGVTYRLFRERDREAWFVEGVVD